MTSASEDSNPPIVSGWKAILVCLLAVGAAALPHFFLDLPIDLYRDGQIGPWIGLTTWIPTFLAAVGIFCGADFRSSFADPLVEESDGRAAAVVLAPIVATVVFALMNFDGNQHIGAWSELGMAMAVYGATYGLAPLFWQGFMQRIALEEVPWWGRTLIVSVLGAALWLPYMTSVGWSGIEGLVIEHLVIFAALAIVFESGATVAATMLTGLFIGLGWAFAHQMTFF